MSNSNLSASRATQSTNDSLVDEREAGALLGGISTRTLQRWRCEGKGPSFVKLGKLIRYRRSSIDEFVAGGTRTSTSDAAA